MSACPTAEGLAYSEFGDPKRSPRLLLPWVRLRRGWSRCFIGEERLERSGLRVIGPRPSGNRRFGTSTQNAESLIGRVMSRPFADALGLKRFGLLGNSGGRTLRRCVRPLRFPNELRPPSLNSGGWRMDWPEGPRSSSLRQSIGHDPRPKGSVPAATPLQGDGERGDRRSREGTRPTQIGGCHSPIMKRSPFLVDWKRSARAMKEAMRQGYRRPSVGDGPVRPEDFWI